MPEYRDITGQRFGKLVAIRAEGRTLDRRELWLCKCDCGNTALTRKRNLITGNTKSCGCLRKENGVADQKNFGCMICGSDKHYAKGLCRNCYRKRSGKQWIKATEKLV